jgi:hypothetical protein
MPKKPRDQTQLVPFLYREFGPSVLSFNPTDAAAKNLPNEPHTNSRRDFRHHLALADPVELAEALDPTILK